MVDPKVTNGKAQEILKSMNGKYDSDGNMTVEYFEQLEKDFLNRIDSYIKKKPKPAAPEAPKPQVTEAPKVETPKVEAPKVEASQPQVQPVQQAPPAPVSEAPKMDAVHQARAVAAPAFSIKQHSLDKIKKLMENGVADENGKVEIYPEQAQATLAPLIEFMSQFGDDDAAMIDALEVAGDVAKDKLMDPQTGEVSKLYAPRAVQVWKQSMVKKVKATPEARAKVLQRYNTLVPFSDAEKRADPVIEAMNKDFNSVFSMEGVDPELSSRVRLKSLGAAVGNKLLKYVNQDLMWLDSKQLSNIINKGPGVGIKGREGVINEEDIEKAKHELRVRGVIQKIQDFLWQNYNITTYLGSSMFGSGEKSKLKRAKDIPKLEATLKQLTEELESADVQDNVGIGKSGPVVADFSEFPEEEDYFIIKR